MSGIPGSYPKVHLKQPRAINADNFIMEYLKNEKSQHNLLKTQARIRNPFYAGSVFYQRDNVTVEKKEPKKSVLLDMKQDLLLPSKQQEKQFIAIKEDVQLPNFKSLNDRISVKSLKSKSSIQTVSKLQIPSEKKIQEQVTQIKISPNNPAGRPTEKRSFQILPLNSLEKLERFDKFPLIQPIKEVQKKTYDQNLEQFFNVNRQASKEKKDYALYNPIAHQKLEYKPNRDIAASWDKYDRPQFKDSIISSLSPAQMITLKNKIDNSLGFQTSSQAYGFGQPK